MESFSTNGECLAVGSRQGFVIHCKRGVVSLALPTVTFLRNKTVPVVMGFSFAENAPKYCFSGEAAVIFQAECSMFP